MKAARGSACNPFTAAAVVGVASALSWMGYGYIYEVCDSRWIAFNATGLWADLDRKLFGQHIAKHVIMKAVNNFKKDRNPAKPLVLSLHGPTGTGKNFVSQLIAKNLYQKGMDSKFVHFFSSTHHFPHKSEIDTDKAWLQQHIQSSVSNCEQSMFIFDEIDKLHPTLIDSIKPYLDYFYNVDGVSYREAIFIFISNTGGEAIIETALEFWRREQHRNEIELEDLEKAVSTVESYRVHNDLWRSHLINKSLVDFFVPFLPLRYPHIVQCVMAEMEARGLTPNQDVAMMVARDLDYYPERENVFSVTGCKTINSRLDFFL